METNSPIRAKSIPQTSQSLRLPSLITQPRATSTLPLARHVLISVLEEHSNGTAESSQQIPLQRDTLTGLNKCFSMSQMKMETED